MDVFRGNMIACREIEVALRRTNLQFDAALNSMLHGMLVWGPDYRLQLVNGRFSRSAACRRTASGRA